MDRVIAGMILGMVLSWAIMGIVIAIGYRKPKSDQIIRAMEKGMRNWDKTAQGK